jgi:TFIIF-interacting CTD phosphatase-like protein
MLSPGGGRLPAAPLNEDNVVVLEDEIPETPKPGARTTLDRTQLSPMHPPKPLVKTGHSDKASGEKGGTVDDEEGDSESWVGKKVDQLFSPMLNLLSGKEDEEDEDGEGRRNLEDPVEEEEEEDNLKPPASDSTHTTSQETEEEEEEEHPADEVNPQQQGELQKEEDEEDNVLVEDDHSSQASEEEEEDEFNPYAFIKSLPKYELVASLRPPITLPPKDEDSPPISLVLDLDETLVHCTVESVDDADLVFPVEFHGCVYQVHVRLRPYLFEFLEKVQGKFEVIVFTASQKVYANELLNLIDPGTYRIFFCCDGFFFKKC